MPKMDLKLTNEIGKTVSRGKLEIKNQSGQSADFFIYGDIISDSWGKWCEEDTCPKDVTDFLTGLKDVEDLHVYINSGGGSVFAGVAIYQQLKRCKAKKTVHIDGLGASIASVIAMAGDEIIMPEGSMLMVHKPMNSYFLQRRNADELRKDADMLDRIQENMLDIYMQKAAEGATRQDIEAAVNRETWMNTEQAAELFVITREANHAEAAADSSFYSHYLHTPKALKEPEPTPAPISVTVDIQKVADQVSEVVDAHLKTVFARQQERNEILQDLEQYGK